MKLKRKIQEMRAEAQKTDDMIELRLKLDPDKDYNKASVLDVQIEVEPDEDTFNLFVCPRNEKWEKTYDSIDTMVGFDELDNYSIFKQEIK